MHVVRPFNTRSTPPDVVGEVRVAVTYRGPKGEATVENVLVDTGATHTVIDAGLAEALGLAPRWRHTFETANGFRDLDVAEAEVKILGRSMKMPVAIADLKLVAMTAFETRLQDRPRVRGRREPTAGFLFGASLSDVGPVGFRVEQTLDFGRT